MTINKEKDPVVVMVSGGFDPLHIGHLGMFKEARKLGDKLLVVVNCNAWLKRKKGKAFMFQEDRAEIIKELKCVDDVYVLESDADDVCEAIEKFRPDIFANGGDRKNEADIPEAKLCKSLGIEMVFNVGPGKIRSSSDLLEAYTNNDSR